MGKIRNVVVGIVAVGVAYVVCKGTGLDKGCANSCRGFLNPDLGTSTSSTTIPEVTSSSEFSFENDTMPIETEEIADDTPLYVNDSVYQTILNAKNMCGNLINNGDSVSQKMISSGVNLNDDAADFIDSKVLGAYNAMCSYVDYYDKNEYNKCVDACDQLLEYYDQLAGNNYLFNLLVTKKLPSNYQSDVSVDEYGYVYDSSNNITLQNGSKIRFLGGQDDIVTERLDDISDKMSFFAKLPSMIFNVYTPIKDTSSNNDGVCYIINETKAGASCTEKLNQIISEGAEEYGFDPNTVEIAYVDGNEINSNVFTSNGQVYGKLSYSQNSDYDVITTVNDAIKNKSGDVLLLDGYVSSLYNSAYAMSYQK